MNDYSSSPENGEDNVRLLTDNETGEVFRVVKINHKGNPDETLTVASLSLIETTTGLSTLSTRRQAAKPKYLRAQPAVFDLMIEKPMTPNEQKVLGVLLKHTGYSNQAQLGLAYIAESAGIAKENACRALKSLRDREVLVERANTYIPGLPIYVIDPSLYFCGSDEARDIALARFHKDLKRASDAKKPKLSVVK